MARALEGRSDARLLTLALLFCAACARERPPVGEPLPAPKRVVDPKFGPALAEMKRLADELVLTPRAEVAASAEELRAWALEGWLPAQAKRRALFAAMEAARPASDLAGAALLEGRAMESLADDWTKLHVAECSGDPTVCKIATHVAENARQVWIERARERYQACAAFALASDDSDKEDYCSARDDALRKPRR